MLNLRKFLVGIGIVPKTTSEADSQGELEVLSTDGKLRYHDGSGVSPVVTEVSTATLTNKTIDADVNTIADLETDNLKAGVLSTDLSVAPSDTQIPSALAVTNYVTTAVGDDVDDLVTLTGVAAGSTDLGTFTGTTIPDNVTIKAAAQALETAVETKLNSALPDTQIFVGSGAGQATPVAVSGDVTITNTGNVQIAPGVITNADVNASAGIEATKIANGSVSNAEFQYLDGVTSGIQGQLDTKVAGPASAVDNRITRFDGITGKTVQSSSVTLDDGGNLAGVGTIAATGAEISGNFTAEGAFLEGQQDDSTTTGANATLTPVAPIIRLSNASLTSIDMIASPLVGQNLTIINQTGNNITINNKTGATPTDQIETGTKANLVLKDEASIELKYDGTEAKWCVIGGTGSSASAGINYILNPDFEAGTTGWAVYANAVPAAIPQTGTGGAPTVTIAASASAPLRGTQSGLFTKTAANSQGQGLSYAFTIDSADQASIQRISFDYSTSTNYVDTVSGNLVTSDMQVFVYDVTNAQLIYVDNQNIGATTQGKYVGSFQTSSNSTSYRLILHCATTNATVGGYTVKVDNFALGPQNLMKGMVGTDWVNFTPTGTWTTNTTYTGKYKRIGESVHLNYTISLAGAPNATTLLVNLPAGMVLDTSKLTTSDDGLTMSRNVVLKDASAGLATGVIRYFNTTSFYVYTIGDSAGVENIQSGVNASSPFVWASGDKINIYDLCLPIQGWSSNLTLSEDTGNRLVAAVQLSGTPTGTITTGVDSVVIFPAMSKDTTSSYNAVNGQYTVPETGFYDVAATVEILATISASNDTIVRIRVAGSNIIQGGERADGTQGRRQVHANGTLYATKGQVIDVVINTAGTGASYGASLGGSNLSIAKRASPQTLAGSETVAARYSTNAGQTVATAIVNFEDLTYDTHNAVTIGASWRFTAPMSGKYSFSANIVTSATPTVGDSFSLNIFKNNSSVAAGPVDVAQSTTNRRISGSIAGTISLVKGDFIDFRMSDGITPAAVLEADNERNYVQIERVGN